MASTYEPIATYTASGSSGVINFSSFSGYTDLILIISGNTTNSTTVIQFNGDTGTNYSRTVLRGEGSTASSFRQTGSNFIALDGSVSQPLQNGIVHIMNYANSTTYKTTLQRSNLSSNGIDQGVGLWRNTAAITTMSVTLQSANYTAGTTFTLYGIKAA